MFDIRMVRISVKRERLNTVLKPLAEVINSSLSNQSMSSKSKSGEIRDLQVIFRETK